MLRKRKWQVGLSALGAPLLVPLLLPMSRDDSPLALNSPKGSDSPEADSNTAALALDAQTYADAYNVTTDEARRRIALQGEIGRLNASLSSSEKPTSGGLWIQHTPSYAAKVAFTEGMATAGHCQDSQSRSSTALTHGVDANKAIYMAFNYIQDRGLSLDTD